MNIHLRLPSIFSGLAAVAAVAVAGAVLSSAPARAQLTPWGGNSSVLVDQSVAGGQPSTAPMTGATGGSTLPFADNALLPPPTRMPTSELLVNRPPGGGTAAREQDLPRVNLTPPGQRQRAAARTPQPRPDAKAPAKAAAPRADAPPMPLDKPSAPKAPEPPAMSAPPPPPVEDKSEPPQTAARAPAKAPEKPVTKPAPKLAPKPDEVKPSAAPPPPPVAEAAKEEPKPADNSEAASEEAKPEQQAARTEPTEAVAQNVTFDPGGAELSGDAEKLLDDIAGKLSAEPNLRMQLLAYAGERNLSPSKARRLSLSRALAVRSYLIGKGVRSTRIDVRALGNRVPDGAPNRVDLRVINR